MSTLKVKNSRISRADKECVVRNALGDVPQVEYLEEIRKLLQAAVIEASPPEIQAVYKSEKLRDDWLEEQLVCVSVPEIYVYLYIPRSWPRTIGDWTSEDPPTPLVPSHVIEQAMALAEQANHQKHKMTQLGDMLRAALLKLRTREEVMDKLPEFAKYLPPMAQGSDKGDSITEEFKRHGWGQ